MSRKMRALFCNTYNVCEAYSGFDYNLANGCIFSNWGINRDWHNKNLIIFFLMSNKVEPMVFIETDDYSVYESAVSQLEFIRESMRPPYMRQFAMVEERIRNLWQEEPKSQSCESSDVYSGDDEMEADINEKIEMPKIILVLDTYRAHQIMEYVVNVNYRGQLKKPLNLKKLDVPHSNYHLIPHQLVINDDKGTVIFFSSGKFRVMGCINAIDALFLAFKYTDLIDTNDIPELYSQSYTSVVKLGYEINLDKLAECSQTLYIPQLFAAVCVTKNNPVSVV